MVNGQFHKNISSKMIIHMVLILNADLMSYILTHWMDGVYCSLPLQLMCQTSARAILQHWWQQTTTVRSITIVQIRGLALVPTWRSVNTQTSSLRTPWNVEASHAHSVVQDLNLRHLVSASKCRHFLTVINAIGQLDVSCKNTVFHILNFCYQGVIWYM